MLFIYTDPIEINVSGIGYRVPPLKRIRRVLFKYLRQSVTIVAPLARYVKMMNRVCDTKGVDCIRQSIKTFRNDVV